MRKVLWALAIAGAIAAVALALLVASTFPRKNGALSVAGISREVQIETDDYGVPTIRAGSPEDALFGLGYVHARDRLWQMEFQRRTGAGRLAEALGPRLFETDRFLRTVGFRRAAETALTALSKRSRRLLEAYVRGVNQFLASSSSRPIEFRLLRVSPEPFEPVDSLTWAKMMAWDLGANAANEIRRARFTEILGAPRAAELLPPAPPEPTILRDDEWIPSASTPAYLLSRQPASASHFPSSASRFPSAVPRLPAPGFWSSLERAFSTVAHVGSGGEAAGSNSWVLSGSRSKTGGPILANDPHLGFRAPSLWYLARLEAPGYRVAGATLPGVPGVIIGRNRRIAWGLTSLEPDVQDLYVEKTDPTDGSSYFYRGKWRQFQTRKEIIRIRGEPERFLEVRSSVHGPIVSDVLSGAERLGPAVALRWTGLDLYDTTAEAFFRINTAGNWKEFLEGAALLRCPGQNLVYADADGHIGYTASGAIPIRPRSNGLLPVSGTGEDDWRGYIPFERLPRVLDPSRGFLVAANNRVASERYPYSVTADWPEPYRAQRITDLLSSRPKLGVEEVRAIQRDHVSYQARELLPLLLDTAVKDPASRDALTRLASWNMEFAPGSVAASIYAAWYTALSAMPEDELRGAPAGNVRSRFLINALASNSAWCDDIRTAKKESCGEFKAAALRKAVGVLREKLGPDPGRWHWERLHRAHSPHAVFDQVPLLGRLFSLETGQGGDASTVNVGAYRRDGSFRMTEGSSYRQIVDFSEPARHLFVLTTGQSGNVFDPHYRDLLPFWRRGELIEAREKGKTTLLLKPAG